tara:strand:+ start:18 stop:641 length:624 start_codon:yes stop_codon:yes gene_type:complete
MLTVYGRKSSANVQKVHWICAEGKLDFEAVNIGGKYGGHTSPNFRALNPNSTIPVLKDNNFTIYESNSIIRYLSDKFNIIRSEDSKKIALNNQWIDWSSLVFGIQCATYTAHNMLLPPEKRNPTLASEARDKIDSSLEILDDQLKESNFIIDDNISLADIPIGCWLHRCVILDIDFSNFNHLKNWYNKLKERKAFEDAVISAPKPPN